MAVKQNTIEISEYFNRDLICSKIFYGVYPANKISKLSSLPTLIVCNTDTSSRPGEHWIVLYVDEKRRGEYFDSMGRFPTKWFKTFLDENCIAVALVGFGLFECVGSHRLVVAYVLTVVGW